MGEILRLALVGGIVGLDTTAAFQIMICQPLVGGLLTGWALGDPVTGAFVGLLFQGFYLAEIPAGGRIFPDGNLAAVQAAALAVYGQNHLGLPPATSLLISFIWSIPAALFFGQAIVWTRKLHAAYLPAFDRFVEADRRGAVNLLFGWIVAENFLISAALTIILFIIGRAVFQLLSPLLLSNDLIKSWGSVLRGGLLGAGCAVIFAVLVGPGRNRKILWGMGAAAVSAVIWAAGI